MNTTFLNSRKPQASLGRFSSVLVLSATLVACGGGGADGSAPPTTSGTQAQTIAFAAIAAQTLPAVAPMVLSASASSGLGLTFTSTTPAVCTVSGTSLSLVGGGSCAVTASQAGNATYAAATPVVQTFTVNKANQTLTFGPVATPPSVGTNYALQATSSAGLGVTYAATPSTVCSVSGTSLSAIAAGTCTVTASQAGNAVYAAAADVQQAITVAALASPTPVLASAANGKTVYEARCSGCHGRAPNIAGGPTKAGNRPDLIRAAIGGVIGAMAGLGPVDSAGKISTQNIEDIALYLAAPY